MSTSPKFQVIGAGLPRTGTASLREALQILGFGPTTHMFECWNSAELSKQWMVACRRIAEGDKNVDLRPLVEGFGSGVDTPVSDVFIELAEQFPEAKVVLTHRPAKDWFKSYCTMSQSLGSSYAFWCYWQRQMSMRGILPLWLSKYGSFGEHMMAARIEEAKKNIPAERLLIFQVQEGWEPLCKFLNVPIPDQPFPRVNDTNAVASYIHDKVKAGRRRWFWVLAGVSAAATAYYWIR
ncbi:P-loop containing nucleoside triphosphate hydrolase protein [Leucosporidium creatinivorum]|uniref:p-loop containing nucleoside triphosphate hydrolase protein n=1 Tax=Leucosporidium creatinivorum TaxID=106004 RepID=A0A1Y2G1I4_9BASI|nr:P-loop containing nucleoside triphosphate hydrolase protein [Leucosporidium creatinivorum]